MKEFKIDISEEAIKKMPDSMFKALVKKRSVLTAMNYLKEKQKKLEKGSDIEYQTLELQDYLSPSANLPLEDQQLMFSLRCKMKQLKVNFSRNDKIKETYSIKSCLKIIDNEHLTWCEKLSDENDFRY